MSSIVLQDDNLGKSFEIEPAVTKEEEQKFVDEFFKEDLSLSVS
jgi:hypothetical protein